jgi:undecaprenyl-diphosphatase
MDFFQILILSLIQGVTEFLPVSSDGHLKIMENLFGINSPTTLFDVSLHAGTLLAVLIYLRKEIINLSAGIFKGEKSSVRLLILIIVASVPTAVIGFLLSDITEIYLSSMSVVGACLILNALILLLPYLFVNNNVNLETDLSSIPYLTAFLMGIAQGIAVLRGVSRSGTTIASGILMRLNPDTACCFSFLISIPAILGALLLSIIKESGKSLFLQPSDYFTGALISFAAGYVALSLLFSVVRKGSLHLFAPYCALIGFLLLVFG